MVHAEASSVNPPPVLATFVVRRRPAGSTSFERQYPARVLSMQGDEVEIAYLQDNGTICHVTVPARQVQVHQ